MLERTMAWWDAGVAIVKRPTAWRGIRAGLAIVGLGWVGVGDADAQTPRSPQQPATAARTGSATPRELGDGLDLTASWEPLHHSKYGFGHSWPLLRELKVAERVRHWSAAELAAFGPPADAEVGTIWRLEDERVLALARQFHAGAALTLHHRMGEVDGARALLRARGPELDEVVFRLHAEFALDDRGSFYTPAQFAGRVTIERASGRVIAFWMGVPARDSNVDLNRVMDVERAEPTPPDSPGAPPHPPISADIGFVAKMELAGGDAEAAARAAATTFERALPEEEARKKLARAFYAFAAIDWLPLDDAVAESFESGRPLHLVVLFGTLDDESC